MPMIPISELPKNVQSFIPIGAIALPIVKDCIWRAYAAGAITIDEVAECISKLGEHQS